MRPRLHPLRAVALALVLSVPVLAQSSAVRVPMDVPVSHANLPAFNEQDLHEWLTFLSSDTLQGREVFTEGYGMAASYVADHLRSWGVTPLGDDKTYFQVVKERTYQVTRHSSVTIEANGRSRTFADGEHVTFPVRAGGRRTLTFTGVDFVSPDVTPTAGASAGTATAPSTSSGRLLVYLPGTRFGVPREDSPDEGDEGPGVAATIRFVPAPPEGEGATSRQPAVTTTRLTTVRRVDGAITPQLTGDETFYEALLAGAPRSLDDLRDEVRRGQPPAPFTLRNVTVTIHVDNTYDVVSTRLTENVVGLVPGRDPKLRDTYVFFGAHLDHVGYRQAGPVEQQAECRPAPPGDLIFNGADDDGSGTTALMAMAKALAEGPKPKRSVVFIWHAGEEAGLLGSRYMADFPVVPLDHVQAELNIDMIGRNRDDDPSQANTVYVIGADRISTDLHNLVVATNRADSHPLHLDYEYNDPDDPNSFYTRSDHYSYASKGIPIAFFFTGTHADYHCVTDEVGRIIFPKLARVAELIYRIGYSIADSDGTLVRDDKGARSGRGFQGYLN
ncbi:MAG TPA: M20/M25/M40 family metallo-hydrolase [Vicinamibacterales bacterium]|nr:M20/M25/M40 family metallo-hydrolase [Vicinamibacterales bacterium]